MVRHRVILLMAVVALLLPGHRALAADLSACALLSDPQALASISGAGETALRARCGEIALPSAPTASQPTAVPPSIGPDVLVNNRGTDTFSHITQSETSVAVSNSTILVGFNDSGQLGSLGDFTGYSKSTDNGATWTDMGAPTTPLGSVAAVFGDPVLVADLTRATGGSAVFYFANLADATTTGTSIISVHKTINGGTSWASAANASPLAAGGQFQDKEWMAVDTRAAGTGAGNIYVCWTRFGGAGGIQFSRSTNGGASFTQLGANLSGGTNVQGCSVAVDPNNGRVYVAWADFGLGAIRLRRSTDFGATFGTEVTVGSLLPTAESTTSCGGATRSVFLDSEANATQRAVRSAPFPNIAVSPTNGHVYAVWHKGGLPGGAGADIAYARSTDAGLTFGAVSRINSAVTGHQFFPAIAVNTSGRLAVNYYSTQNSGTNRLIDLYKVDSADGVAFSAPVRITDVSFNRPVTNPNFDTFIAACYMGDYNGMTAPAPGLGDATFRMAWGDNRLMSTQATPDPDIRFDTYTAASTCGILAFASTGPSALDSVPTALWFAGPLVFVLGWRVSLRRRRPRGAPEK